MPSLEGKCTPMMPVTWGGAISPQVTQNKNDGLKTVTKNECFCVHLILWKGQNKTKEIRFIKRNEQGRGYDIPFDNGKTYTYGHISVCWFQNPAVKNPQRYRIRASGESLDKIDGIYCLRKRLCTDMAA